MIDTIILQIPISYRNIINHNQFTPSTKDILNNSANFYKYTNNPKKIDDKENGDYMPRLTIIKRVDKIYLKVEFSAPKLLFDNNLEEVEEEDFNEVVNRLKEKINKMGVNVNHFIIEYAEVLGFHPSKNIILNNGYTSSFVIKELSKINLNQKFDLERVSFRNDGESIQFYTNRHSLVLYDKINDLNKPAKRAIDKDQTSQQINLFEYIKKERKKFEVLRFEIRLSHKNKMKEILEKVGFTENLIFKNIFKKDLCQKIFKLYWEEFFGRNRFIFSVHNNPQIILQKILMRYPKTNIRTAVMLVGLCQLCKDEEGIRGFRSIAKNYRPKTNWIMLSNYLKKFEDEIFTKPAHGFIKDIEKTINEFKAFKFNKEVKDNLFSL